MIIYDYRIKFIFIYIYIYIFSCVKIWVNPILTQPLKDQVRVIGYATHLGWLVFLPEPAWVEPEPDCPDPFAKSIHEEIRIYMYLCQPIRSNLGTVVLDFDDYFVGKRLGTFISSNVCPLMGWLLILHFLANACCNPSCRSLAHSTLRNLHLFFFFF